MDNRLLRGQETRRLLMHAAEKLIAEKGIEQVSIREILNEAGQNNTSALQYHFGNLAGLIAAIHLERSEETRAKRAELMDALLSTTPEPDLRQLCALMIRPAFDLARSRADFRRYVKAFGHQLTLLEGSPAATAASQGGGGDSGIELGKLLKRTLSHLSEAALRQRLDFAVRLCSSAMYAQARTRNAFRGQQSNFFITGLIDALVGLLSAPESRPDRD
jgi:AcrR family transcriptional regulator